jgi:hypothetical protein
LENLFILKNLNFEQNNLTDKQLEIIRYESDFDEDLENQLFLKNLFVGVSNETKSEVSSTALRIVNFHNEQLHPNLPLPNKTSSINLVEINASIDQSNPYADISTASENSSLSFPNK